MTQFHGSAPRADWPEDDRFAVWDGAYVLGALSSTERREFEVHLSSCTSCRRSVSELSGMPALLALMDRDAVAALDGDQPELPPLRPEVLESLLTKVGRRRRRRRLSWAVVAAAAAVLVVGLVMAIRPGPVISSPQPPQAASALTLLKVVPSSLDATVMLLSHGWGTSIEMTCSYREDPKPDRAGSDDDGDRLAMVVVGRDGSHSELATWTAQPGKTALPGGSTSLPIAEIVAVQVVSADNGDVFLQRNL